MDTIYEQRRIKLIKSLQQKEMKHAIIFNPANIFYYTNFLSEPHERFMALYIDVIKSKIHLFVPALDQLAAQQEADIPSIIAISDNENPYAIFKKVVPELTGNIGIEGNVLSYHQMLQFEHHFSNISFHDVQPIINKQRMHKTADEIKALKKAIHLIEQVLEKGISKIKTGMTEIELTAELEYLMLKVGADGPSFSSIVLAGEKAALPHGSPGEKTIEEGQLLLIDFGVIKNGYCSDITRTFAIGDISKRHQALYDIVLESTEAGILAVKAGVPLKQIDAAARKVIEKHGFGDYFNNRIGHGLGIEVHESPSVHGENEDLATNGMVFTIEPGIYIPEEVGIRIEDIVYINDEGETEVLTTFPKTLQFI